MESIESLAHLPATEVKRQGWRGVVRAVIPAGKILVTNHNEPEVVLMSVKEYARIVEVVNRAEAKAESDLESLRRRFDERLAALRAPGASAGLRAVMESPARLKGKVKAGSRF